jgi:hypothetical protein
MHVTKQRLTVEFVNNHLTRMRKRSAVKLLLTFPSGGDQHERKGELRLGAQAAIRAFAPSLCLAAVESGSSDLRRAALEAIKVGSKNYRQACFHHATEFMSALITGTKDINLRVKYVADRGMKYLLDGGKNAAALQAYLSAADPESGRYVKDYCTRVLVRMSDVSDDESDQW